MIFPWARVLISAGAHGLRRIPGQSANLAHPFWRNPCAPAPLDGHPRRVFLGGAMGVGGEAPLLFRRDRDGRQRSRAQTKKGPDRMTGALISNHRRKA